MTETLPLSPTPAARPARRAFALDAASREAGRRGLRKARAALAQARTEAARERAAAQAASGHRRAA